MTEKKIKNFIKGLLQRKKTIPKDIVTNLENFRYLDHGQIDSLELIFFISKIEKKFNFKFSSSDLSSKEFRVVSGLIKIIKKRTKL